MLMVRNRNMFFTVCFLYDYFLCIENNRSISRCWLVVGFSNCRWWCKKLCDSWDWRTHLRLICKKYYFMHLLHKLLLLPVNQLLSLPIDNCCIQIATVSCNFIQLPVAVVKFLETICRIIS
jgi:hypothetical protein